MDNKINELFNKWFDVWIETEFIASNRDSFRQAFEAGYNARLVDDGKPERYTKILDTRNRMNARR